MHALCIAMLRSTSTQCHSVIGPDQLFSTSPIRPSPPSLANFHDIPSSSSASALSTRDSTITTYNRNHDFHNRYPYQAPERGAGPYPLIRYSGLSNRKLTCVAGPHRYPRNHLWPDLPWQAPRRYVLPVILLLASDFIGRNVG